MFITFLIISLVISLIFFAISCVIIKRLLNKIELYERWIIEFKEDLNFTVEKMREIDRSAIFSSKFNEKGLFESDDQVGEIFKELIDLIEKLNRRIQ